ncbi:thrombospondin type-1 domain-containing protein 4-like [Macrosteles quadrilineatus]|uniref:thrombospondin type-1 domain-containing protein 4-like n=1 Tax=Macrosteles quadrilineatus TaxID=74068 RepID=UPI0023E26DAD|nr:thrombospondin type-1 domain-containing protein 4-like [Macrosteles quadrilineatus]
MNLLLGVVMCFCDVMASKIRMAIWIRNIIRLVLVLNLFHLGSPQTTVSTPSITSYPSEVHQMIQQRIVKGQPGSWSSWSPWTPCTRSCGGGVTIQTRECRSKPLGRHRRRVHSIETQHHCVGLYKRIHICNTKECPGTTDFRQEQCSRYDGQEFLGRAYTWEPFMEAPNQCALNCRAKGFRFYATLNASVEDGTPCRGYIIGHDTDRWVCIAGQCKVGAYFII